MRHCLWIALIVVAMIVPARADSTIDRAVQGVVSSDPAVARQSVLALRNAGPAGLAALLQAYDREPDAKLAAEIDEVAAQHDAVWSGLYWYTDLNQAEAAAKAENKPILYLRLLGKLTDEYSCANSRFFRTILYANAQVSALLRERFILVWESERPVPVITVDYGDGRVLKRTITGNSIHYVLNPDGEVIDALPGVYGPAKFAAIISADADWQANESDLAVMTWTPYGVGHLPQMVLGLDEECQADFANAGGKSFAAASPILTAAKNADAAAAMPLAMSKSIVETPLLRAMSPQFAAALDQAIGAEDETAWQNVAALHADDAKLDASSVNLIRSQNPMAYADPMKLRLTVDQFQRLIALDQVHNEYQFRRQILRWLGESQAPMRLEDLNRQVYSQLFLTPRSDPWLGLAPENTYTALSDDGLCAAHP